MQRLEPGRRDHDLARRIELDIVKLQVLRRERAPQPRQACVLRVEGVALAEGANRGLDDEFRSRNVRLAEIEPEHAVHRQRQLPELADTRVRNGVERGGIRSERAADDRALCGIGHLGCKGARARPAQDEYSPRSESRGGMQWLTVSGAANLAACRTRSVNAFSQRTR